MIPTSTYLLEQDYLKKVKGWLDSHPRDVITLLFIFIDPADGETSLDALRLALVNSGIAQSAYVPLNGSTERDKLPTLAKLIDIGQRVIVLVDNALGKYTIDGKLVSYIIPLRKMVSGVLHQTIFPNQRSSCRFWKRRGTTMWRIPLIGRTLAYPIRGRGMLPYPLVAKCT